MSTQTTNYNLIKPELTDTPDITAMNVNWDTIDEKLGELDASPKIYIQANEPSNPEEGLIWIDTSVESIISAEGASF